MTHTVKNFDNPDETRSFNNGKVEGVSLAGRSFGRATFEPGWKWSNDVKPVVGGESCQVHHVDYALSGKLHVVLDGGHEFDVNAGDLVEIPPGHDGWVVGDEPFVAVTLIGEGNETNFAKPA